MKNPTGTKFDSLLIGSHRSVADGISEREKAERLVFLQSRYSRTLAAIGASRLTSEVAQPLAEELIDDGERAVHWHETGRVRLDEYHQQKLDFLSELPALKTAIARLVRHFKEHSDQNSAALYMAIAELKNKFGIKIILDHKKSHKSLSNIFEYIFSEYSNQINIINNKNLPTHIFLWQIGPLYFKKPLKPGARVGFETFLLFTSVYRARCITASMSWREKGVPMPTVGKPLMAVACAFVADVTAAVGKLHEITTMEANDRLRKFLKRNDVEWMHWPKPDA